jgi:Phage tail tube protein
MKPFTYVEQVRDQPDSVVDRAAIGCVVNDWTVSLASGPGRANARVVANFVGTGNVDQPSAIVMPALIQEHFLNAASATIDINGVNYVLNKTFVSCDITWNNNVRLDEGFYPGSGTKNGAAIRGRMEHGDRTCGFTFRARMEQGSPELVKLMSQTTGPATITLQGALIGGTDYHGCRFFFPKVIFSMAQPEEQNGIITVNVTATPLKDPAQPYVQFEATTTKSGILLPPSA